MMKNKELIQQDPREVFGESDPRELWEILNDDANETERLALIAKQLSEVYSDDSIPYSYE